MKWTEIKPNGKASPFVTRDGFVRSLCGHTTIALGNKILLYGGKLGEYFNSSLWILDLLTETWIEVVHEWVNFNTYPLHRWKHASCADSYTHVSSKVYKFLQRTESSNANNGGAFKSMKKSTRAGGAGAASQSSSSKVPELVNFTFDGTGEDYINMQQVPIEMVLHKYIRMYVFGGSGTNNRLHDLHELSVMEQQEW